MRDSGVTIILTTHYIEEAEEMADRIGVISKGEIDPGRGQGRTDAQARQEGADACSCSTPLAQHSRCARCPTGLALSDDGSELIYTLRRRAASETGITALLRISRAAGIAFKDLQTEQSSLEDIFVSLVKDDR